MSEHIPPLNNEVLLCIIVAAGAPVRLRRVSKRFKRLMDDNKDHIERQIQRLLAREGNTFVKLQKKIDGPGPRTVAHPLNNINFNNHITNIPGTSSSVDSDEHGAVTPFIRWQSHTVHCVCTRLCDGLCNCISKISLGSGDILIELWVAKLESCKPESIAIIGCGHGTSFRLLSQDCSLLTLVDEPTQLFKGRLDLPFHDILNHGPMSRLDLAVSGGVGNLQVWWKVFDYDGKPFSRDTPLYPMVEVPRRTKYLSWDIEGDRLENIYISLRPELLTKESTFTIESDWKIRLRVTALEMKKLLMPQWKALRMINELMGHSWCQEVETERVLVIPVGQRLHGFSDWCHLRFHGPSDAIVKILCDRRNLLRYHYPRLWVQYKLDDM